MAKTRVEVENPMVQNNVISFIPPSDRSDESIYVKCSGCNHPASYLLYENREPHCRKHMLEAIDSKVFVLVRSIEGGYDDAS